MCPYGNHIAFSIYILTNYYSAKLAFTFEKSSENVSEK
jgi:hypothetical protein